MDLVFQSWDEITITENHIKQLHRDLLVHSEKDERHRGGYKTGPNNVVAFDQNGKQIGIVFETATPFDTPRPFQDSNGRLSRILTKLTGVSRNTLKEHFRQLVEKGYLAKQGGGRSTWYVLK
jgi:hypothetical protein